MLAHAAAEVREETATIRRLVTRLLNHEGWTLRRGELRRLRSTHPTKKGDNCPMTQNQTMITKTTSRDLEAMADLKDYLPLPSTLQAGIFHTLFVYLSDGGDAQPYIQRYQTLWEALLGQNQAGLVGTLLVKEIVLAALMLEVAQKKLTR